jgi:hypothetical protein
MAPWFHSVLCRCVSGSEWWTSFHHQPRCSVGSHLIGSMSLKPLRWHIHAWAFVCSFVNSRTQRQQTFWYLRVFVKFCIALCPMSICAMISLIITVGVLWRTHQLSACCIPSWRFLVDCCEAAGRCSCYHLRSVSLNVANCCTHAVNFVDITRSMKDVCSKILFTRNSITARWRNNTSFCHFVVVNCG